ncbi:hypothetical protein BDN72DRAFT_385027 [Pluteus cervinus]|uniref:Uncharacterized protein n=1 Tax=Pluteus cervinus TaxID=181527 RepID=A0ACD3AA33_9AGAR|nr:hypothetical protein BDN72DRAFT_385027 [Pluteus cervinus]
MAIYAFSRCLPATSRAYSIFSKPGSGGRYFTPKPPKPEVPATANKTTNPGSSSNPPKAAASAKSTTAISTEVKDGAIAVSASSHQGAQKQLMKSSSEDSSSQPKASSPHRSSNTDIPFTRPQFRHQPNPAAPHPIINAKDFKLHQFFSLHRPLLLLSDPAAIFHSPPPSGPLFAAAASSTGASATLTAALKDPNSLLYSGQATSPDDTVDASVDADAEAARQLTRAVTMTKGGATADWESTLKRLGLDVNLEADRVELKDQMARDWDVTMDSTQRKRRKKMKKHKLKKRRKATRSQRLKIGR